MMPEDDAPAPSPPRRTSTLKVDRECTLGYSYGCVIEFLSAAQSLLWVPGWA